MAPIPSPPPRRASSRASSNDDDATFCWSPRRALVPAAPPTPPPFPFTASTTASIVAASSLLRLPRLRFPSMPQLPPIPPQLLPVLAPPCVVGTTAALTRMPLLLPLLQSATATPAAATTAADANVTRRRGARLRGGRWFIPFPFISPSSPLSARRPGDWAGGGGLGVVDERRAITAHDHTHGRSVSLLGPASCYRPPNAAKADEALACCLGVVVFKFISSNVYQSIQSMQKGRSSALRCPRVRESCGGSGAGGESLLDKPPAGRANGQARKKD